MLCCAVLCCAVLCCAVLCCEFWHGERIHVKGFAECFSFFHESASFSKCNKSHRFLNIITQILKIQIFLIFCKKLGIGGAMMIVNSCLLQFRWTMRESGIAANSSISFQSISPCIFIVQIILRHQQAKKNRPTNPHFTFKCELVGAFSFYSLPVSRSTSRRRRRGSGKSFRSFRKAGRLRCSL